MNICRVPTTCKALHRVLDIWELNKYSLFLHETYFLKKIINRVAITNLDCCFSFHHNHPPSSQHQKMQTILLVKYVKICPGTLSTALGSSMNSIHSLVYSSSRGIPQCSRLSLSDSSSYGLQKPTAPTRSKNMTKSSLFINSKT